MRIKELETLIKVANNLEIKEIHFLEAGRDGSKPILRGITATIIEDSNELYFIIKRVY